LTDETDQLERKDTDPGSSSDDDYKECDNDGGVEIPHPLVNQTPYGKLEEPSLSNGETKPQQSVTPPYSKKLPDSK